MSLRRFFLRLAHSLRRDDRRMREEMETHLALDAADRMRKGVPEAEARRRAALKFGARPAIEESYRAERRLAGVDSAVADVRYALRTLRRSPGFAAAAILTVALGTGASTAIFSVVDAALLHPLSYPHPDELVRLSERFAGGTKDIGLSVPEWRDLAASGVFARVAPVGGGDVNLTGGSEPARIRFAAVSPNYFALLGVDPQLGHAFNPGDPSPGFTLEAVISDGLWTRAFDRDPHILGRVLRLDTDPYRIIGVMPAGFHDPGRTPDERHNDIWLAFGFAAAPAPLPQRNLRVLTEALGRLAAGVTLDDARRRLTALTASVQQQHPGDYPARSAWTVDLTPLKEDIVGTVRPSLLLLFGAVGLVWLIACANIANLQLARASVRAREMAVRQALGASWGRLARQLLTESLLLSLAGGVAAVVTLALTSRLLLPLVPAGVPQLADIAIDWRVLGFALTCSALAGAIFGLAPALHLRRQMTSALREQSRSSTTSADQARMRQVLVVGEFALSLVLMVAAGLLLRSFAGLLKAPLGFSPDGVVAVRVWLPIPNDPSTDPYGTPPGEAPFLREVLRRSRSLAGVEDAAIAVRAAIPLGHTPFDVRTRPMIVDGREGSGEPPPVVEMAEVSPGYFRLLRIPLLRGRLLAEQDDEHAPQAAVINQALADAVWPATDPIGRRFKLSPNATAWATVVGIIPNVRIDSTSDPAAPEVYVCAYQRVPKDLALLLRGPQNAGTTLPLVRAQVQAVDPTLPVYAAETLDDALAESLAARRLAMLCVAGFAATALLLAGIGIYGVISYLVSERTAEIAIRTALGAQRGDVTRLILGQGVTLAGIGTIVGLAGARIAAQLMAGVLYGVNPGDPATFAVVAALLAAAGLSACYLPARRAARLDPVSALKRG
jgi:putative ABC transport system permease protein